MNGNFSDGNPRASRDLFKITLTVLAAAYLLSADYPPLALGVLVCVFFATYIWVRVMVFFEDDCFTPKRLRVSMTWALVGLHEETDEYDRRPVRVYFALLTILFVGLLVRPVVNLVIT